MSGANRERVFCLSIHADCACRHSGACCTAGWRIPVEPATEAALVCTGLHRAPSSAAHASVFERDGGLTVLRLASDGACVFLEQGNGSPPSAGSAGGSDTTPCPLHAGNSLEAIRQADALLVHAAATTPLAAWFSAVEKGTGDA